MTPQLFSFRRTGAIATPSSSHAQDVVAYSIASEFTPPDKRRRGYAQHMMRLLHWVLAPRPALKVEFPSTWGAPPLVPAGFGNARFSVLYSDIGKEFYRTCGPSPEAGQGWVERGSAQTAWDFTTQDKTHCLSNRMAPRWEYLSEDDAKAVWTKDAEWMKADLAAAASPTGRTLLTFLPDKGVGAFLIHRAMSFSEDSDMTPVLPLEKWGAVLMPQDGATLSNMLDHSDHETCTFATWTMDKLASSRTLVVTRLRADAGTLPDLLRKLIDFARQEQVERVEIWALTEAFRSMAERLGWVTEQRQEHLSAFKWYGEETDDQVEWMFNEKYAQTPPPCPRATAGTNWCIR